LWGNPWTLLLRRDTYEAACESAGTRLLGVTAELRGTRSEFLEIEIAVVPLLGLSTVCKGCGRFGVRRDGSRELHLEHWPPDEKLARVAELPTAILAKESFAHALGSLDPDGVSLSACDKL
jgi:hypothetical protein